MTQHVRIVESTKFHYAKHQWRIEVGRYTLLRLTYGQTGGVLKTATAGDGWGRPVFPDPARLIEAMAVNVENLAGPRWVFGWKRMRREGSFWSLQPEQA